MRFFKPKSYSVQATFPIHHGKNCTRDGKRIHCGLQGPFYLLLTFTRIPAAGKHKGLDLGLYPAWSGAKMKAMVRGGQAGLPTEHEESSTGAKGVQGLASFHQQFRWWHTRRKSKVQGQLHKSVLSPATSLAFLGWCRWQQPQDSSHHRTCYTVFPPLISCYTTGVFLNSELQERAFRTVVPLSQ